MALDVGYDSPSAFIAMSRRELGATPRRYVQGVSYSASSSSTRRESSASDSRVGV